MESTMFVPRNWMLRAPTVAVGLELASPLPITLRLANEPFFAKVLGITADSPVLPTMVLSECTVMVAGRERKQMTRILNAIWNDDRGQDLIEYALMAGFVAVAAGAIMPGVSTSISTIFSKLASVMSAAD
jgi:pilus assembly protein Flp/PilA